MVECLCFSGKSTAANAMNEFVRVKEWQNIYVQKVECWSFGNHDKAALLIVIAMSYTFTHPLTHSLTLHVLTQSHQNSLWKLFAKLWTVDTPHTLFVHTSFMWSTVKKAVL